ncbi:MAG: RusA family crossover junction endodeoxyribonuclease [Planctomycetaceae bacterium]|nr:RusA family crossover junction endodeoxyribonuclease [Planctomycetaceae bacterium]
MIEFQVLGQPATQGSKKVVPIYGKHGPIMKDGRVLTRAVEDNPQTAVWRQQVASAARIAYGGPLLLGPIALRLVFERPRPKGHFGSGKNASVVKSSAPDYPTSKPDSTKLTRAVEDSLTGVLWQDDSQVVEHHISKRWGLFFRVYVRVVPMGELTDPI